MWDQLSTTGVVQKIVKRGKRVLVALDNNILRPAMGGQDSDRGFILKNGAKIEVIDVIKENGEIFLVLPQDSDLKQGDHVEVNVDIDRRKKLSIIHTAQHIFFQSLIRILNDIKFENVFLTVKDNLPYGEIIISSKSAITPGVITEAEVKTNDIIFKGLEVKEYWIDKNELDDKIRARDTLLQKVDRLRIIEVDGFDWSACSGTHVKNTRDIYFFKVKNWKRLKPNKTGDFTRYKITFFAGPKALEFSLSLSNELLNTSQEHGFRPENLAGFIGNLKDKLSSLENVKEQFLETIKNILIRNDSNGEDIAIHLDGLTPKDLIRTLKDIRKRIKKRAVLCLITNINNEIYFSIMGENDKVNKILEKIAEIGGQYWGKEIFHGKLESTKTDELDKILKEVTGHGIVRFMELEG